MDYSVENGIMEEAKHDQPQSLNEVRQYLSGAFDGLVESHRDKEAEI